MRDPSVHEILDTPQKDIVFRNESQAVGDFRFDASVANVFDDMVSRSVPFYNEMQRMVSELAADFATPGTSLYDLGCSTATTLLALNETVDPSVRFVGMDNSQEMLAKAAEKVRAANPSRAIEFMEADLHSAFLIEKASVVTMLLTLQFVRPLFRERTIRTILNGLQEQGCLILIEKLTSEDSTFNRLFINHYFSFKRRNGYSDLEIARKREALENVLIPYRLSENFELLRGTGFRSVELFFRWYNFCGIIAVK
jgi:tRNA (cmo5U34)-methyltransferase